MLGRRVSARRPLRASTAVSLAPTTLGGACRKAEARARPDGSHGIELIKPVLALAEVLHSMVTRIAAGDSAISSRSPTVGNARVIISIMILNKNIYLKLI
jgi:hypothetical protein